MIEKQETVDQTWADVETQYQRRADLIGNLVSTVKGAAESEQEILTGVIEARSNATSIKLSAEELTPENIQKFQDAQSKLSGALSRLLVTVEKYPELKSQGRFADLQVQLEGTENRIAVARSRYNEKAKEYNTYIRQFPRNFTASWFDFEPKGYFQSEAGSEVAPKVEF